MDNIIIDICFCMMFLAVPIMALRIIKFAGVSLFKFSIPSLFILFYLVFAYIGIMPLYFGWDDYPIYLGVVDKSIIFQIFVYSSSSLITIILGFIYAHKLIGFNSNIIRHHVLETANRTQIICNSCLLLLCGIVLLIYLQQIDAIAFLKIINGDYVGAAVARSNMGNSFTGKYWRYHLFIRYLLDYSVLFFFADYLIKRSRVSALLFGISFVLAFFTATMALEKGPLANLLIMLYLVYVIFKGGDYWQSPTKYLLSIFVVVIVLTYIYSIGGITGDRTLGGQLLRILSRIFTGQITPAYFYLDLFPGRMDYLMGASFPNPGAVLPFENYPLVSEVANYMFPQDAELGVVGSAPTVFWGEMYVNFGPIAVLVSSFVVGTGLFAVSHILSRLTLSPPVIAATVFLSMHYRSLSGTSISGYFIDFTLIAISAVTIVLLFFRKKRGMGRERIETIASCG